MADLTTERARQKALDLIARAKGASTRPEGQAALLGLGKLVARYPALLEPPPVQAAAVAATVVDAAERVRSVANDPNVRSAVASGTEAMRQGAAMVGQVLDLVDALKKKKGGKR